MDLPCLFALVVLGVIGFLGSLTLRRCDAVVLVFTGDFGFGVWFWVLGLARRGGLFGGFGWFRCCWVV